MPGVKGILLATTVRGIHGAISGGALTREAAESRLEARDVELLDEKLDPTRWYPVSSIASMADLLAGVMGGPSEEALRRLGGGAAEILRASRTYQQLNFEPGCLQMGDVTQLRSLGRLIASVWPAMYDFGTARVEPEPESSAIVLRFEGLGTCPAAVRHTIEGFTARIADLISDGALEASYPACPADQIVIRLG
jgi:hypothetical protein